MAWVKVFVAISCVPEEASDEYMDVLIRNESSVERMLVDVDYNEVKEIVESFVRRLARENHDKALAGHERKASENGGNVDGWSEEPNREN